MMKSIETNETDCTKNKHALIYEDNYGINTPVRLKCTICGKRFGLNKKGEVTPIEDLNDDNKTYPRVTPDMPIEEIARILTPELMLSALKEDERLLFFLELLKFDFTESGVKLQGIIYDNTKIED